MDVEFAVLGELRVVIAGIDVTPRAANERSLLAAFDGASRAVRCGAAAAIDAAGCGIGVHAGECTDVGHALRGDTISLAQRVAELARPGEVIVTESARLLALGSSLEFDDRGPHPLHESLPNSHLYVLRPPSTAF